MSRADRSLEALLDGSGLPAEHRTIVVRVVRSSRLPAAAELEVAEELVAHFADGLDRGVSPSRLVGDFGSPEVAATLIRRGQRRKRNADAPWRGATVLATSAVALIATTVYVQSAIGLHVSRPARAAAPSTTWSVVADGSGTPAWVRGRVEARAARERVRGRHHLADDAAARVAMPALLENLDDAARLARLELLQPAMAAIDIAAGTMARVEELCGPWLDRCDGSTRADVLAAVDDVVRGGALSPAIVRAAYADLLDRVYADGRQGRLTADGLRVLQGLRGKTRPGVLSIVLEPTYFTMPARRAEVEAEVARLLGDRDGSLDVSALRHELGALNADSQRGRRYFVLGATLPELVPAVERANALAEWTRDFRQTVDTAPSPHALAPRNLRAQSGRPLATARSATRDQS